MPFTNTQLTPQCMPEYIPLPDERNREIMVWIDGNLYPRDEAKISVFDSVVQGGDAVWEGLRVYNGHIFKFEEHLDRLFHSAHAMAFEGVPSRDDVKRAVFKTLEVNGQMDETHIRLTLTRGRKVTSGMSPHWNKYGCSLIVLAEWKKKIFNGKMLRLISSSIRRNPPMCIDSKIHHNNLINNILAKIEANVAGVDDAVMLDLYGFASETNAMNLFIVKDGKLFTPFADACLPGITRATILRIAAEKKFPHGEKNLSITELYTADECFTTGSMGEVSPVAEIDGRRIGTGRVGPITEQFQSWYTELTATEGESIVLSS